jgi:hypothetical protein
VDTAANHDHRRIAAQEMVMETYIGTKLIKAAPMTRAAYNDYRGWTLPENENGEDAGYLVEYIDGGKPNDDRHEGYISWSPVDVFDNAYRLTNQLTFGQALEALKAGQRIARAGWNGKDMWVALSGPLEGRNIAFENFWSKPCSEFARYNGGSATVLPCINMKTADGKILMGWLASQTDMLADDWVIIP